MNTNKYPPMPEPVEEIAVMASAVTFAIKTPAKDYYTEAQMHAYADSVLAAHKKHLRLNKNTNTDVKKIAAEINLLLQGMRSIIDEAMKEQK